MSIGFAFTLSSLGKMTALFTQADKNMYENKMAKKKRARDNQLDVSLK